MKGLHQFSVFKRLEESVENPQPVRLDAKRDDLIGLGGGGNKLRKLEFLMGEAIARGCDTFITTGGTQSNHARLAAAAAANLGLNCELVLRRSVTRNDERIPQNGNILLDKIFGATVHEVDADEDATAFMEKRAMQLQSAGRHSFVCAAGDHLRSAVSDMQLAPRKSPGRRKRVQRSTQKYQA